MRAIVITVIKRAAALLSTRRRRMKLRSALLASAMVALPLVAANAQAVDGLYVGGGLGVNFLQSENFKFSIPGAPATAKTPAIAPSSTSGSIKSYVGPAAVVSLGWGFGNGIRAEVEGDIRENGFKGPCGTVTFCGGSEIKTGVMVNAFYDFVGLVPMFQPYVGVGVGYQQAYENNLFSAGVSVLNNNRGSFAYQGILGGAFPIASVPGLAITAEYRFMGLAGNRTFPAVHKRLQPQHPFGCSLQLRLRATAAASNAGRRSRCEELPRVL
jgi:opacity protein-like surface antigen